MDGLEGRGHTQRGVRQCESGGRIENNKMIKEDARELKQQDVREERSDEEDGIQCRRRGEVQGRQKKRSSLAILFLILVSMVVAIIILFVNCKY